MRSAVIVVVVVVISYIQYEKNNSYYANKNLARFAAFRLSCLYVVHRK